MYYIILWQVKLTLSSSELNWRIVVAVDGDNIEEEAAVNTVGHCDTKLFFDSRRVLDCCRLNDDKLFVREDKTALEDIAIADVITLMVWNV